jgi:hypothetical protein
MAEPRMTFVWSDSVAEKAAAVYAAHALRIRERLPQAEVRHHGGPSVPGLLTSGDVDLHVRANDQWFEPARDLLCELYEPLFRDEWDSDVAHFVAPDAHPAVEIVLTLIGSGDDLYHGEAWQRIAADHDLAARYNDLSAGTKVRRSLTTRPRSVSSSTRSFADYVPPALVILSLSVDGGRTPDARRISHQASSRAAG